MNKEKLIKAISNNSKKRYSIIGLSLFILIFLYLLFSDFGLVKRFSLLYQKNQIEERISNNLNDIEELKQKKIRLISDSTEIERTAREKYGYVKANEHIYIIKENE